MFTLQNIRYRDILTIPELRIPSGEVTCIVGRSGSGKSTLMRLLNRMISPDEGSILYKDTPITAIDPVQLRRRVVMLPQTPVMFDGSVRDNFLIGLEFSGREPVGDDLLHRVLEIMDLRKGLDDDASQLSGGEKQRVALGRILVMQPEVALLDEPSSALDEGTERIVLGRLADAARERGVTLVVVTHSRPLANAIADNLIEVDAGRIVGMNGERIA